MSLSKLGTDHLVTVPLEATVRDAAHKMSQENVGSVVVVRNGMPVGIVTDRDLVLRVLEKGHDPQTTRVEEVMSSSVVTAPDDLPPSEAVWRMREHMVRRLPVVGSDGQLIGIVTLDDLVGHIGELGEESQEMIASFHAPYRAV